MISHFTDKMLPEPLHSYSKTLDSTVLTSQWTRSILDATYIFLSNQWCTFCCFFLRTLVDFLVSVCHSLWTMLKMLICTFSFNEFNSKYVFAEFSSTFLGLLEFQFIYLHTVLIIYYYYLHIFISLLLLLFFISCNWMLESAIWKQLKTLFCTWYVLETSNNDLFFNLEKIKIFT